MYQNLKREIKEIIEIVKQCPETLQEKCFELLLENFLNASKSSQTGLNIKKINTEPVDTAEASPEESFENGNANSEIAIKDFHVKIQRFLNNHNITIDNINYLYYKEDGKLMPLYDTLNSTNMCECQIRLALLTAFENAFSNNNGEMVFNCSEIRIRCNAMKCYNQANFSTYFKSNTTLWENWPDKPDKNLSIALSSEGKKELAKVLLDLAKGE